MQNGAENPKKLCKKVFIHLKKDLRTDLHKSSTTSFKNRDQLTNVRQLCSCYLGQVRPEIIKFSFFFFQFSARWPIVLAVRRGCGKNQQYSSGEIFCRKKLTASHSYSQAAEKNLLHILFAQVAKQSKENSYLSQDLVGFLARK